MTEKEFYEKHGDEIVVFKSYYKYGFTFEPTKMDSEIVYITYGGCHDDIYKFDLEAGKEYAIKALGVSSVMFKGGDYHNFDW